MLVHLLAPLIDAEEWLLEALHSAGLGWGLAIVALTAFVRTCTVPLLMRQLRVQQELREHLPELKRLQRRLKQDPERLRRETLEYYRRHGINPLAPLAPLVVQIPVFVSLYYVMRTDVRSDLFGGSGFLFIPHLSSSPHGAVLAALILTYLATQVLSSAIATRRLERGQRGLALALPLLFAGVVARFPAGLAVYWITSGLWGLGQQVLLWRAAPAQAVPVPQSPSRPPPRPRKRKRRG